MDIIIVVLLIALFVAVILCLVTVMRRNPQDNSSVLASMLESQARRYEDMNRLSIEQMERQHEAALRRERENTERLLQENRERSEREISEMRQRMEERSQELRQQSMAEFRNLTQEALRLNSDGLRQANAENISSLLQPLKERIEQFSRACTDSYVKENASRQSLVDQIDKLINANNSIGEEARNLTNALKYDSQKQGRWGEIVLETLLEKAGLTRNINYYPQLTKDFSGQMLHDEEGKAQRPDVVILLPDKRCIVVDSKVSLKSYMDYCNATDDAERTLAGKRHVESVKNHVKELAAKKYQQTVKDSAEHVLMFMPNEGAYLAAVQLEPDIWNYAYDRKVVIVSPAHLFSVVQLITQMWRQDKQNRNAEKIASLGGLLYDRIAGLCGDMEKLERCINSTQKAYGECYNSLTKGARSVVNRAERMRELGAKTSRRIPETMADDAGADGQNADAGDAVQIE